MLIPNGMKHTPFLVLISALSASTAVAAPGGRMFTVNPGRWSCELPGDAVAPPVRQPADDFVIVPDSSYRAKGGKQGSYLRLANILTLTSGPFNGRSFKLNSETESQRLGEDGKPDGLRCVRSGPANGSPAGAQSDGLGQ